MNWLAEQVEQRRLEQLIPNARNARTHSEQQVLELAASLEKFGWVLPLVVDEEDLLLVGHGRVLGAQVLVSRGLDRFEIVPVIVARGWDDEKKRAYMLADNRLAERSDWNLALLGDELQRFDPETLGVIGFSSEDLAAIASDTSIAFDEPPESVKRNVADMERIKAQRRQGNAGIVSKTDTENYLVIVYRSRKQREDVLRKLGLPADERYVPGDAVEVRHRFGKIASRFQADRETKAAKPNKAGAQG
jgi:ParB-like chromosome segregation protein Spo0J